MENGQGDVLIAWENEAFLTLQENPGEYWIVVPSASILCQPTVAEVDANTKRHGTHDVTQAYLKYLYSTPAQELEAKYFFRPCNRAVAEKYQKASRSRVIRGVPKDGKWIAADIDMTDIRHFGGWDRATREHFADEARFDRIYTLKH